jgi:hypothetical protein
MDGVIRLKAADPSIMQGHADWVRHEPRLGAIRGFSLSVRSGAVCWIQRTSQFNPAPEYLLEDE